MNFDYSDRVRSLSAQLLAFMDRHVYPNERVFLQEIAANRAAGKVWTPTEVIERLKIEARAAGLWNLFLPNSPRAPEGLSNLEYAPLCEIMGRVPFAAEVFNCSAPDTGNMETLERYASEALKQVWLPKMVSGEAIAAIAMTEPGAGSDLQGVRTTARRDGDDYPRDAGAT